MTRARAKSCVSKLDRARDNVNALIHPFLLLLLPLTTIMSGKRPLPEDGSFNDPKRIRSNNGSPLAPSSQVSSHGESEMERKKREAAERMAAVKARLAASKGANGSAGAGSSLAAPPQQPPVRNGAAAVPDVEAKRAEAQRKIAEMKARMAAQRGQQGAAAGSGVPPGKTTASPVNGGLGAAPQPSDKEIRILEARARAEARAKEIAASRNIGPPQPPPPPPRQEAGRTARGGLGVGLHPSLMADSGPTASGASSSRVKTAASGPKFSTTKGNQQPEAPRINPYLVDSEEPAAANDAATFDPNISTRKGVGERKSRQIVMNEKGKYMAQAQSLRQQARLEEMKRRIAAETRKTEIEEAVDKAFLVPKPPDVEWWDEGLLPEDQKSYSDCLADGRNKIDTPDSIITALIQHPVQLQAPQDKFIPAPKPLKLTEQEQKKLRRQRRMADMKEEQAKIRLGLIEPPAPKVKKSNMMRVLGEQAVKDPTAVEARVNREIAARASEHVRANEERKLTDDQRHEKLKAQQAADEAKGVRVAVFRVEDLSSGKHRYQVDVNAKQNNLSGIVVLHPTMNLVIVEGGVHSIANYKKLMLNRIKWAENTLPLGNTPPTTFVGSASAAAERRSNPNLTSASAAAEGGGASKAATWLNPLTETGDLKDLSENRCMLVWEGEEQAKSFKRWGSKAVETDGEARDVLARMKMENMSTLR